MKSEQGPQAFLISVENKPIILVRSSSPSFWDSCISIVDNLEASYKDAFKDRIQLFNYNSNIDDETLLKQVQALYEKGINELIVIDHFPSITRLLATIDKIWIKDLPQITIHTFGGFTYRCDEYASIEQVFSKIPLKIVSPSSRAVSFVSQHFEASPDLFFKLPFPVSVEDFRFSESFFKSARKHFKLSEDNKVITYAGRIANGKNLGVIFESVSETLKQNPQAVLMIAGEFDDSMTPGFGISNRGEAEAAFSKSLFELDPLITNRVRYLGKISKNDLKLLYHASDVFMSLSTYPLEDFGMAPAEALASGCPAILTDWGGFSDFCNDSDCMLVPVSISNSGLMIDTKRVTFLLNHFLKTKKSANDRHIRSQKFADLFSRETIAKEIQALHTKPYSRMKGFSAYGKAYLWINKGENLAQVKDTFYHSLYRSFFE